MNRFLTKKKAKDAAEDSTEIVPTKSKKKSKKGQKDAKPEVDLATVLPSNDEFRTSLLMPNLSARFSMLREQDDPSSKLGKANDDSVLFPRRASRLNLFNRLGDIAETSSIDGAIRPPFAMKERSNSYTSFDGYGTDDDSSQAGSVMDRTRPIDGNNLFGGRQKVYNVTNGSSSTKNLVSPTFGKAIYERDLSPTHFPPTEVKARDGEERRPEELKGQKISELDERAYNSSPSTTFSKNRGTQSSTGSGPSNKRTSTAATSIDSQTPSAIPVSSNSSKAPRLSSQFNLSGLDRSTTINRRLYGVGADANSSSEPLSREPTKTAGQANSSTQEKNAFGLLHSKSVTNVDDVRRKPSVYTSLTFRTTSPPPTATPPESLPRNLDIRDGGVKGNLPKHGYGYVPPLSPPSSEGEDAATYLKNVQPEDRGKATAMGLFNKPAQQYDDQQFQQRQIQLQESRNNLPPKSSPPTTALPNIPPQRSRDTSDATTSSSRSQPDHLSKSYELPNRNESGKSLEGQASVIPWPAHLVTQQKKPTETFLDMVSPSDDETEKKASSREESTSRHHRNSVSSKSSGQSSSSDQSNGVAIPKRTHVDILEPIPSPTDDAAADSPTLGPGMGLSGLIQTHLRHDSDRSSVYPPPSPKPNQETFSSDLQLRPSARTVNQPASVHSNPWEYADALKRTSAQDAFQNDQTRMKHLLGQTTLSTEQAKETRMKPTSNAEKPESNAEPFTERSWQDELQARHYRGGSTETQREREEFEQELAERRRKVQERLRSVTDANSRSASPIPPSPAKPGNAFSMLRQKTSKGALATNQSESQHKAMRMLGLGNATMSSNSQRPNQDMWKEEEEKMLADFAPRAKPRSPHVPQSPHFTAPHQQYPNSQRDHVRKQESVEALRSRSATPSSSREHRRDRSPPTNTRSTSRNERYREDVLRSRPVTNGNRAHGYSPETAPPNIQIPPRPSVDSFDRRPTLGERSASAASGRYRAGSRPPPPLGYFDNHNLAAGQSQTPGASPRPSPMTPYSAASTTSPYDMSPALPIQQNSEIQTNHPYAPRKRSVNKGMISEPTFLSSTSTVSLGLRPEMGSNPESPPIPIMNPRRRRPTVTQTQIGPIGAPMPMDMQPMMPRSATDERSHFSDDGDKKQPRQRQRLRKSSSEGGNLNARARQHAMQAPSPALPSFPRQPRMDGGMI